MQTREGKHTIALGEITTLDHEILDHTVEA
jgi:hypothetical protein